MNAQLLTVERRAAIAVVTLNRPDLHNAFDEHLIAALTDAIANLGQDSDVRALVLTGAGPSFSAGADMNWMRRMAAASEAANRDDAEGLAALMRTLAFCPKPTIARVNGSAFGGGVGLISCCDVAISVDAAKFALTETKLGLVPAVISPYVIDAIGFRQCRRYFQTAEIFDAERARQIGLVHDVVAAEALDAAVDRVISALLKAGPIAVGEAKALAFRVAGRDLAQQQQIDQDNARLIARLRVSAEGQEGLSAFLDKRSPAFATKV
ncbi:enoyl-CoA hydratase [Ahniella affigens]|uniref:Enoyl-CoA hydratase n=1 Tax=Ahniella affigens TaxID=2021234 RepID=A0A2P1PN07_9GAMM|nr:enoyl-CoA hydratase-related protein [Ahniella affigens]AVP96212.1 enoyl-CoA hydratase [Ahniella affigens]